MLYETSLMVAEDYIVLTRVLGKIVNSYILKQERIIIIF